MWKDAENIRIPKIQRLRGEDMIEFANSKIDFNKYILYISDHMQHDRKWIINMSNHDQSFSYLVNLLIPDDFY